MSTQRNHVRHGFGAARPYVYGRVDLPEFVKSIFDAVELERHEFGPESFHVELQIADSVVVIEAGELSPDVTPTIASIYVYVEDVDSTYDRALSHGATPLAKPEDKPYSERAAGFRDSFGNTWWISTFKQSS